jgi:glucose/arabinose dehydrogenase
LEPPQSKEEPIINDPDLKIEVVVEGLELPTTMAFLGDNDFLVLEKETGSVMRIINGTLPDKPLLDLNVATEIDRGLLGVSSARNFDGSDYVFLYFTETKNRDGEDVVDGTDPLGNRLYRYELEDNKLVHPKLLLDLPVIPNRHPGGQIEIDKNGRLFIIIGDIDHHTKAQNIQNGTDPDGTSGILRITLDGDPVGNGIIGNSFPLNLYYAYGIRNSFGMDFDPLTGKLWASENGESVGDEINLVEPGFNSGWRSIQGVWVGHEGVNASEIPLADYDKLNLFNFGGKGKYSDPELTWHDNVGLTALKFLDSDKLGKQYENDMFVGDFNNGNLFHFDLNEERIDLSLKDALKDRVVDKLDEQEGNVLGQIFGGISDIEVGPDGYLYIISIGQGKIFKIGPA